MLIGHEQQLGWLSRELPPITLLLGPDSVGKRKLAYDVLGRHGGVELEIGKLTTEDARQVVTESMIAPDGARKNFVIGLDGATEVAQNILLKTLEEPPVTVRFVLIASTPPLSTITSRCAVIHVGLLTDAQVGQVLRQVTGLDEANAAEFAPHGAGRVAPALQAYRERESLRTYTSVVGAALKSAMDPATVALSQSMRTWELEHTSLLHRWASERASGRWHIFSPDFAPGASQEQARQLLAAMSYYSGSRQCALVALESVFGRS